MLGLHRYQIIIIDAINEGLAEVLKNTIRERVLDLGLEPNEVLLFLRPDQVASRDRRSSTAAAYFGGRNYAHEFNVVVEELVAESVPIVPVVSHIKAFRSQVPNALHKINGFEMEEADPKLEGVAALMLEMLRLMRDRRRLFISYKRTESHRAAMQLYHELDRHGFQVFLDTHAVRQGEVFQDELFQRMADCDLLIFLNTATVLDSDWVLREVEAADAMGITALQLIWPGVDRDGRTLDFFPEYLEERDFDAYGKEQDGGNFLTRVALSEIVAVVERLRARALSAREARLLGPLKTGALENGLNPIVQRTRYIDLERTASGKCIRVVLGLGVPDAIVFHDSEEIVDEPQPAAIRLLYDGQKITPHRQKHLKWLNGMVKAKMIELQELEKWLAGVKEGAM